MATYTSSYTGAQIDAGIAKAGTSAQLSETNTFSGVQVFNERATFDGDIVIHKTIFDKTGAGGEAGQILTSTVTGAQWKRGLSYLTTAPESANTNGNLIPVVLSAEPTTKYEGYLYIITES